MAKVVSDETAVKIIDVITRFGTRGGGDFEVPRDLGSSSDFNYKRFRLDYVDGTSVKVNAGKFRNVGITILSKNDTSIAGIGNDVDGYAATFAASTVHYVWLQLHHATTDKQLTANVVKIYCDVALPTETRNRDLYREVGSFTTDGDGLVQENSIIRYKIGDIDLVIPIPDAELSPALAYPLKTLEWRRHFWEWQMYDADEANQADGAAWSGRYGIPMLLKDANNSGTLQWLGVDKEAAGGQKSIEIVANLWQIYKMNAAVEAFSTTLDFCLRTDAAGQVLWCDYSTVLSALQSSLTGDHTWTDGLFKKHTSLDFSGSGPVGTGKSTGNSDHDDTYWHAYGVYATSYIDAKQYRTTSNIWTAQLHLSANGTTDSQYWTAAAILANVSGAISLTAGGKIEALATAGIELTAATASFWKCGGNLEFSPTSDKAGILNIGELNLEWNGINIYSGNNSLWLNDGDVTIKPRNGPANTLYLGDFVSGNIWTDLKMAADGLIVIGCHHEIRLAGSGGTAPAVEIGTAGDPIASISVNGTATFSGTVANPTSITVVKGLVTACS
jgi:hypothetical protein